MAKRILVLGSTGMLGHQVLKRLNSNKKFDVFDIVYRNKIRNESIICDVRNFAVLEEIILELCPDIIVNSVGLLIKESNKSSFDAIQINSLLPHYLAKICNQIKSKLVHISTDCVFSGKLGNYNEQSETDASDIYGMSKALGEVHSDYHLTIRTSIVGPELKLNGEGLLHWFLLNNKSDLKGYKNVFWGGVTTIELAKVIEFCINHEISGIWNVTNGKSISKFEMLEYFSNYFKHDFVKKIIPSYSKSSNKSLKSLRTDISYVVPDYEEMFKEMKKYISANFNDYPYQNLS